jgi:putative membrane protein
MSNRCPVSSTHNLPEFGVRVAHDLRRLHPLSPVFLLLADIRRFIVPLVGLAIFGYYDHTSLWPFIGIGAVMLDSLWKYVTCRYGIVDGVIVVKEGLLGRSYRKLPIAQVKKVSLYQSTLQRALGVASLSMTTAVGHEPEVELSVIELKAAIAIETVINAGNRSKQAGSHTAADELVLAMPLSDVVRLGVISPKSFAVLGLAAVAFFSSRPDRYIPAARAFFDAVLGTMGVVAATIALTLLLLLLSRLVSIAMAVLHYHSFRLSRAGALFTIERGLLARWRTSVSRNRIQKLTMYEGPMHRWLKRRSVKALTTEPPGLHRLFRSMAPLAPPAACESLIDTVFPESDWLSMAWKRLHTSAALRFLFQLVLPVTITIMAIEWATDTWELPVVLLLAMAGFSARKQALHAGYAFDGEVIAVRAGYWFKRWRVAKLDRLQALALSRSPLDRLFGTSTLQLDIPSNRPLAQVFSIRYLPESEASYLFHRIGGLLSKKLRR